MIRRREFIAGLGGVAAWPIAAHAQQVERMRRIGVLMALDETDPEGKAQLSGFTQALAELGWTGRNVHMDAVLVRSHRNRTAIGYRSSRGII
jgi:putative tryptophan/tyrosine transport system substrate-binding protein